MGFREVCEGRNRELVSEELDRTPVEVPFDFRAPPSIKEELQRYVRYYVSDIAREAGLGSFAEEDDFEIEDEDDEDLVGPYDVREMGEDDLEGNIVDEPAGRPDSSPSEDGGQKPEPEGEGENT